MSNSIAIFQKHGLINSNFSYSEVANAFLSSGYTSAAGNTYFNSIRVAEGILIKEDVGQGYAHTFLNGIKIYSIKDKTLLADKIFNNVRYNKRRIKIEAKKLLLKMLVDSSSREGYTLDYTKAEKVIENLLNQALNENQNDLILKETKQYLSIK
jgi:hypothetical protein